MDFSEIGIPQQHCTGAKIKKQIGAASFQTNRQKIRLKFSRECGRFLQQIGLCVSEGKKVLNINRESTLCIPPDTMLGRRHASVASLQKLAITWRQRQANRPFECGNFVRGWRGIGALQCDHKKQSNSYVCGCCQQLDETKSVYPPINRIAPARPSLPDDSDLNFAFLRASPHVFSPHARRPHPTQLPGRSGKCGGNAEGRSGLAS